MRPAPSKKRLIAVAGPLIAGPAGQGRFPAESVASTPAEARAAVDAGESYQGIARNSDDDALPDYLDNDSDNDGASDRDEREQHRGRRDRIMRLHARSPVGTGTRLRISLTTRSAVPPSSG